MRTSSTPYYLHTNNVCLNSIPVLTLVRPLLLYVVFPTLPVTVIVYSVSGSKPKTSALKSFPSDTKGSRCTIKETHKTSSKHKLHKKLSYSTIVLKKCSAKSYTQLTQTTLRSAMTKTSLFRSQAPPTKSF